MERRVRLVPLMMSLLLLCACGGQKEPDAQEQAVALQKQWRDMTACSGHLELTADYGERVFSCGMDLVYDRVTGGSLTLTQPELVKGLTARFQGDDLTLSYEGVSLETGPLTQEGLSPLEAVPTLYRLLTQYDPAVCERTEDTLQLTLRDYGGQPGEGLEAVIAFEAETGKPLTGGLYWEGAQIIDVQMTDFQMMTGEDPEGR